MKYRSEIDGLRALAVVPVILFHAGFELFNGGFIGVDVFFVISGYLITTIIIEDMENNCFSFIYFYERRVRRILPALFFVMLACIPFAWMWMVPGQMKDFSQSIVAVSLFVSNLLFWKESGYFDASAEEKPLLHTWSLAVEEQYYVFFPIFLFLTWRFGKTRVFWIIVAMASISLILSEWGWRNKVTANFYLAPTRVWEIFAGSIAAFVVQKKGVQKSEIMSLLGLSAIIFAFFFYDEKTPFPSVYTLVPVVGVVLLIMFGDKETLAAKLLGTKLFVGIGIISYSAYLWHQPLFAFVKIRILGEPSQLLMLALTVFSLFLAILSWRYIEKPFRDKKQYTRKHIFLLSAATLVMLIIFGLIGHLNSGFEKRYSLELIQTLKDSTNRNQSSIECFLKPKENRVIPSHPIKGCTSYFVNNSASVMMIGDSHLDTMGSLLQEKLYKKGIGSYSVSYPGCPPFIGLYVPSEGTHHRCHEFNQSMFDYAKQNGITDIILIAAFPSYLNGTLYDNGEGGKMTGINSAAYVIDEKHKSLLQNNNERILKVTNVYKDQLSALSNKFRLFVVNSPPEVGWDVPKYYTHKMIFDNNELTTHTHSFVNYKSRISNLVSIINSIDNENLYFFDLASLFCKEVTERCAMNEGRKLLYRDKYHLSMYGSEIATKNFIKKFGIKFLEKNN